MAAELALSEERVGDGMHVLRARGEIDLYTAPELREELREWIDAGRQRIVIDLTGTTFVDSTALGVLIDAFKRLRALDGALAIVNVDEQIARALEVTGLDQILTIRATRADALAALAATSAGAADDLA